jgi:voltage-gated potassium channel
VFDRPLVRRALAPVSTFVVLLVAGVGGFMLLTGIGPIEAAFWLLDPTSIELYFEHHDGPVIATKAYALVVFAGLILTGLWAGETVIAAVFGGQITEELQRVQTEQAVASLENHVVICGYGMFGRSIAAQLAEHDVPVVVIERDTGEFEKIAEPLHGINGDARREEDLERAGVTRARALVAAVDDSNVNIQTCIVATQLAPNLDVVVRVGDEMYESLARRAGADEIVIPEVVSGDRVTESLLGTQPES